MDNTMRIGTAAPPCGDIVYVSKAAVTDKVAQRIILQAAVQLQCTSSVCFFNFSKLLNMILNQICRISDEVTDVRLLPGSHEMEQLDHVRQRFKNMAPSNTEEKPVSAGGSCSGC